MWYKVKRICIEKWKSFVLKRIFFIWIIIINYLCDIKSEKSENVLMCIAIEKCDKVRKIMRIMPSTIVFCYGHCQTRPLSFTLQMTSPSQQTRTNRVKTLGRQRGERH
jgi:hypothetical protein